jgi:hypothetical protein
MNETESNSDPSIETIKQQNRHAYYFDLIRRFGLLTNDGRSPCESPDHPFRIPVEGRNKDGVLCKCTAYGKTLEEVCERAASFIQEHGVKP